MKNTKKSEYEIQADKFLEETQTDRRVLLKYAEPSEMCSGKMHWKSKQD